MNTLRPVKTAVIGLGRAGWDLHAMPLKTNPRYQIVACVDPVAERRLEAETAIPGVRTFASYDEFLATPCGAELVIIATASFQHAEMGIKALRAGFYVLVEKPMAVNVKEARSLLDAANGTLLTVFQPWRCRPAFRRFQQVIRSGVIGSVFNIKICFNRYARRNDWQTLQQFGGGMLNNTGAHIIDMALQLMEANVVSQWSDLQSIVTSGDTEDHVKLLLRGANGRILDIEASDASAVPAYTFAAMGSLGSVWLDKDEFTVKYLRPEDLTPLDVNPSLAVANRFYGVPNDKLPWMEQRFPRVDEALAINFHDDLYESIRNGKALLVKPEEIYQQLCVIEAARQGSRFSGLPKP